MRFLVDECMGPTVARWLRSLSRKQRNYVRTSIRTLANELVKLAERFNASIALKKFRHSGTCNPSCFANFRKTST
nr:hypothetical protein [Candidatus Njordarchaeota archaeon]